MATLHDIEPLVTPALAAEADRVAELIAHRLADRALVTDAIAASERNATYPFGWGGAALFAGHPGTALAFQYAARAQPDSADHWRALSHEHLVEAVRSTHDTPLTEMGMAGGTAGLALAFADCVRDEPRYARTLHDLDTKLALQVIEAPSWRSDDGVRDNDYDVIAGAAGVLAYLVTVENADAPVREAIERLIDDLRWLCRPGEADGRRPWFIPPRHFPIEEYLETYPHGYVNLGLAHGIPGPLAALSFAAAAGYRSGDVLDTIRQVSTYLVGLSSPDGYGHNWSNGVLLTEAGAEDPAAAVPSARTTWCYGAPGIACALLAAATALDDDELRAVAVDTFEGVLRRFHAHGRFASATVCHGAAGLLVMCVRFARDTGSGLARRSVADLTEHVLTHCDPDLLLGVQDLEQPGVLLDSPALLTGAAGVALALWSAATPHRPQWERALLIG